MRNCFPAVRVAMILAVIATAAEATVVIQHVGSTDPSTEGFPLTLSLGNSITGPVIDQGMPAWMVMGTARSSQFAYATGALSAAQKADLAAFGFVLTMTVRVLPGLAPAYDFINHVVIAGADVDTGVRRFEMDLGLDSAGNVIAVLPTSIDNAGSGGSIEESGLSVIVPGPGSAYHTYDLFYNPLTQLAALAVDGNIVIDGYPGGTAFVSDNGLTWGAVSGGEGNFTFVRLGGGTPEPSGAIVLGLAAGVWAGVGRWRTRLNGH